MGADLTADESLIYNPQDNRAGQHHYRAWVGPPSRYCRVSSYAMECLLHWKLREWHTILDLGCGSIRLGRMLIPYLWPGHYFGIEPEEWAVHDGFKYEMGDEESIRAVKKPHFAYIDDFDLTTFGATFDYIFAYSIFSHTAKWQIHKAMHYAQKVLKPNGMFFATYQRVHDGATEYEGSEWVYPRCTHYYPETYAKIVREHGLDIIDKIGPEHAPWGDWTVVGHPGHIEEMRDDPRRRV